MHRSGCRPSSPRNVSLHAPSFTEYIQWAAMMSFHATLHAFVRISQPIALHNLCCREYLKVALKPRFQARQLDGDGCKWVLKKVVDKVMQTTRGVTAEVLESKGGGFVNRWVHSVVCMLLQGG